ncbi:DUF5623 domain-containing protein [Brevundimonas sp. SGAir0440]|uniref:DUF5623 domain-containing protein n=1 Tax=Brevundimonas sp. SGAir0440 TaxID=2579977 RepID=UPI0010FA35E2|nr:DUF5623 domain-containing protein [Brevundimonas sp. SGAir0440]
MLIGDVRPTTLNGVKRLAVQLRKERGLKHSNALDIAAQAANCTNFRNAQSVLPLRKGTSAQPYVLLTLYWCNKDEGYRVGRETLRVSLSQPILDICSKTDLKRVRGFGNLRMVADDHFVCDAVAPTQIYARERLSTAERSIRFMEHTGLRPSRDHSKAYPGGSARNKLPGKDHATNWFDAVTGQFILVDEPYKGVPNEAERADWAVEHGWLVEKTGWSGMYSPYKCDLYVATSATDFDLASLIAKINAMPPPLMAADWAGESESSWATFTSPMATTPQDVRRARCRGTVYPTDSATSVPLNYSLGSTRRRPKGALNLEGHIEAGRMIKAVIWSSHRPYGVYRRMNALRSTLEDWMDREVADSEFANIDFFDVYYHDLDDEDPLAHRVASPQDVAKLLGELREKLQKAYLDSVPLRRELRRIDASISLLTKTTLKIA